MLDDYAFVISAFIDMYQVTYNAKWLEKANKLTDYVFDNYFDKQNRMFYYTHKNQSNLVLRKKEIPDNVIPGSNS